VFDKVRENTADLRGTHQTYAGAANLAVNQTLVRSINTSIVALIPVGCILYVGAVQLGTGSLKDLALSLFVGMAAGVYSSVFIATPLLVHLKSNESEVQQAEKRERARRRAAADPYATVPVFAEDMPVADEPGTDDSGERRRVPAQAPTAPPRGAEASGRGRVVPGTQRPVQQSTASGRQQPKRQTRSKRGKK
ncbi:MAG: protein translocase subunit SecF, partial [Nocardioides sp.]